MDEYELVKQLIIEALYSRDLSNTPEGERDGCASVIRSLKIKDIAKKIKDKEHERKNISRGDIKDRVSDR